MLSDADADDVFFISANHISKDRDCDAILCDGGLEFDTEGGGGLIRGRWVQVAMQWWTHNTI